MSDRITCPECRHEFAPPEHTGREVEKCRRTASAAPAGDSLTAVKLGGTEDHVSRRARRGRRTTFGLNVQRAALVLLTVGATTAIIVVASFAGKQPREARRHSIDTVVVDTQRLIPGKGSKRTIDRTVPAKSPIVESLESSIVEVQAGGPGGVTSTGCGFVIGEDGLVATNYHVVAEATVGRVRFKNGASYEIEGYAAVQPENDLAILKLRNVPTGLYALRLKYDEEPAPLSDVVAIGHPYGLAFSPFDGKVSRVVSTAQLPNRSRQFLTRHMRSTSDHQWIQHTAVLSEGNSGGPLLNELGEVIGVNTWVDKESGFGYALRVFHLYRLLDRLLPEVAPLEEFATGQARVAALVQRLSVDEISRCWDLAVGMNWAPRTDREYAVLQRLAGAVTVARFPASFAGTHGVDEALFEERIQAVDRIETSLQQEARAVFAQVTIINEHAMLHVHRPSAGVFLIATVQRVVKGDDGSRGMLAQLAGFNQSLFIPLDGLRINPEPNTHCLVLGINQNGRQVRYGDNPLKLATAPVITSRTILPLEQ